MNTLFKAIGFAGLFFVLAILFWPLIFFVPFAFVIALFIPSIRRKMGMKK